MKAAQLKAPYPWKSLASVWAALGLVVLLTVAISTGFGLLSSAGMAAFILVFAPGAIRTSIAAYRRLTRNYFLHRHTVQQTREEFREQATGSAPLLRPADGSESSLLRASTLQPKQEIESAHLLHTVDCE
jgi:hypothetical protein